MADLSESRINVAALKRVDPYLNDIIDTATHVALYSFNTVKNAWEKTDIEGALFVYSRTGQPFHGILIMNRLNTNNLVEPVTKELDLQAQEPFLLYKNSRSKIFGIWFYDKVECVRVSGLLQRIVRDTESKTAQPEKVTPKKGVDIFGMLSRAQEDYNMNKVPGHVNASTENQPRPPQGPDGTSQSVMDFFAKAKGQQKETSQSQPAGLFNPQRAAAPMGHPHEAGEGQMKPFILQRLMSNPVHSVEHIEKQQRSITPQDTSLNQNQSNPIPQISNTRNKPHNKFNIQMRPLSDNLTDAHPVVSPNYKSSPKAVPVDLSGKTSFHPIGSSSNVPIQGTTFYNSNIQKIETRVENLEVGHSARPSSSPDTETPKKPTLMLPAMFTSPAVKEMKNGVAPLSSQTQPGRSVKTEATIQPEPLTKNQLHQAFNYLLKNDPEFVNKLHEAYVKSFSEMIS